MKDHSRRPVDGRSRLISHEFPGPGTRREGLPVSVAAPTGRTNGDHNRWMAEEMVYPNHLGKSRKKGMLEIPTDEGNRLIGTEPADPTLDPNPARLGSPDDRLRWHDLTHGPPNHGTIFCKIKSCLPRLWTRILAGLFF